ITTVVGDAAGWSRSAFRNNDRLWLWVPAHAGTTLECAARDVTLLRNQLAAAAEFARKILQLGQAIAHRQHGLGIVDMDRRRESERGDGRRKDVDQPERRVVGHQVAAALLAVFAVADRRLGERRHMLLPPGDAHRLGSPQAKGIHGSTRPGAARTAVAVPHRFGRTTHLDLNGATETVAEMIHDFFLLEPWSSRLAPRNK